MENPVFTLSTKPDLRTRRYERGENWLSVAPSPAGLATVHDRDVLIYCISQCMAALNEGRQVERRMRFKAYGVVARIGCQVLTQAFATTTDIA